MKSSDEERDIDAPSATGFSSSSRDGGYRPIEKKQTVRQRIRSIVWDTLDRSPEERRFIAKIDFFILTWASLTYFSKNLNTNNLCMLHYARNSHPFNDERKGSLFPISFPQANHMSIKANAYVSGMKEELNVVGNEYQTFTTMWTM